MLITLCNHYLMDSTVASRKVKMSVSNAVRRSKQKEKYKMYKGNKAEGQGFADKRKKKIQYEYMKLLKKEKQKSGSSKELYDQHMQGPSDSGDQPRAENKYRGPQTFRKNKQVVKEGAHAFSRAIQGFKEKKELALLKKQDAEKKKQEKDIAMLAYQQRKKENFKKLCKKTHKGQPVMKNQIEYLLQKIEKQINQT